MKRARFLPVLLAFALPAALSPAAAAQVRCEAVLRTETWKVPEIRTHRSQLARDLIRKNLAEDAYVVRWRALTEKAQGPWAESGELMVVGVREKNFEKWMDTIGERTVGLVALGLPESSPGTAALRVGRRFFSFMDIQNRFGRLQWQRASVNKAEYEAGWTETTFAVSRVEMDAILDFLLARSKGIPAVKDLPRSFRKGEPIRPEFDAEKFTLKLESCAAACTSWFDPKWMAHYQAPGREILERLADRLNLKPTYIAKQNIWSNARNPETLSLTVIGIDQSERVPMDRPLREVNKWFNLRGMPVHALIPDTTGNSKTIDSHRFSLEDWLAEVAPRP